MSTISSRISKKASQLSDKSVFVGVFSVDNRAGTLLEKSSPRTPPQKPFIAFSPFGDLSPNNEKVVRVYKRVRRKFFSEELTQLCTKYAPINSDLPRLAQHSPTLVPPLSNESPERHESRCLLKPICDGQARRRGGGGALVIRVNNNI